jgi:hyperosmotically inducible periplasmic protein
MKKNFLLLSTLSLLIAACDNTHPSAPNADNTGRNARDRSGQTLTPGDQAENEVDRGLTQKIRQILIDDDSLSMNAKNVKIITVNGVVTLRGAVDSEREKNEIGRKAKSVSGVRSVDNQLEVIRTDNT